MENWGSRPGRRPRSIHSHPLTRPVQSVAVPALVRLPSPWGAWGASRPPRLLVCDARRRLWRCIRCIRTPLSLDFSLDLSLGLCSLCSLRRPPLCASVFQMHTAAKAQAEQAAQPATRQKGHIAHIASPRLLSDACMLACLHACGLAACCSHLPIHAVYNTHSR